MIAEPPIVESDAASVDVVRPHLTLQEHRKLATGQLRLRYVNVRVHITRKRWRRHELDNSLRPDQVGCGQASLTKVPSNAAGSGFDIPTTEVAVEVASDWFGSERFPLTTAIAYLYMRLQ